MAGYSRYLLEWCGRGRFVAVYDMVDAVDVGGWQLLLLPTHDKEICTYAKFLKK